ncbi:MAG: RluA family pseudouridine synthase [Planctomycetaceae bacterium]
MSEEESSAGRGGDCEEAFLSPLESTDLSSPIDITVESRAHGWRLDHYLSRLFPNHSRSELQRAISAEMVRVNGLTTRASRRVRVNDRVRVQLAPAEQSGIQPEDIPLDIVYEDSSIVVVNKPPDMVVHPGRGSGGGTLAAALQHRFDQLSDVGGQYRPGIVHRLDRDTTGVILVARDNQVHQRVASQFEQRTVRKEYWALVRGVPEMESDFVRTFVCPHPRVRERMMVCGEGNGAREAVTFYRTAERFQGFALMHLFPRTGRTHQLRVHMQHIATPILADRLYLGRGEFRRGEITKGRRLPTSGDADDVLISRQALHAHRLTIQHPVSGQEMTFEAPLPEDFQRTLQAMRAEAGTVA